MIKKLFLLIWTLFTSKHVKYNLTNLWWYLTKGYTLSDVQDGDVYILNLVKKFILELNQCKMNLYISNTNQFEYQFEYSELYNLINIRLSESFPSLDVEYQIKITKELEYNLKDILQLWI